LKYSNHKSKVTKANIINCKNLNSLIIETTFYNILSKKKEEEALSKANPQISLLH